MEIQYRWLTGGFEEVTGMGQKDSSKAFDADILQCKADILRARQSVRTPWESAALTETTKRKAQSNEVKFIEQVKSMISGGEQTDRAEVPRFDLAEQIMAEQRKNSAAKRKAPSRKIVSVKEQRRDGGPAGPSEQKAVGEEKEFSSSQEEIIARIVGRDIERLCKGRDQRGQKSFGDQRF